MSFATQLQLENAATEGVLGGLSDEKLERAFREIEEASARRALEEEEEEASHPGPLDPLVSALANNAELALAKKRRRQSISISRVGSYPDVPAELHHNDIGSGPGSPVPWAPPPPLYRANTQTSTTSSLSTNSSLASSHERDDVEETHTTQKETIAARRNTLTKAMSSALSRTLTRMRSRGAINEIEDETVVIGVAVHEATTETTVDLSSNPGSGDGVEESEPGPSRRMSITLGGTSVSASASGAVTASGNSKSTEVSRSRSGSINKLRGKRPLRGQSHTPGSASADVTASAGTRAAVESGAGDEAGGAKASRRLSYFAKALAQRLRKRKSSDEHDKDKDRDKVKDRDKGKENSKSDRSSQKSAEKQTFVSPAPIYAPTPGSSSPITDTGAVPDIARLLDQPIIKSPLLVPPSPPLIADSKLNAVGQNGTIPINTNTLPPSPRRLPSATEIPLPPSPAGSPRSTSSSGSLPRSMRKEMRGLKEAAMVPLPPSPITTSFTSLTSTKDFIASSETTVGGTPTSASIPIPIPEGKRRRLPPSALPDSDFGPMGELTPAPTPSPTESMMSVMRVDEEKREPGLDVRKDEEGDDVMVKDGAGEKDAPKCDQREVAECEEKDAKSNLEPETTIKMTSSTKANLEEER